MHETALDRRGAGDCAARWLLAALVATILAVTACGSAPTVPGSASSGTGSPSSRTPPSSPPSGTATPATAASPTATALETAMADFTLSSTAFEAGGSIPPRFTCDGEDESPDLAWAGAPAGTAAFVLVVDDPDAKGFVHWIAYDLTASESGGLAAGISASPDAPPQGTNDFGRVGWNGPCPPSGEHRYRFTLSALAAPLGIQGAPRAAALRDALAGATVLGSAVLEGRYRRR